jgi:hypothetical protein
MSIIKKALPSFPSFFSKDRRELAYDEVEELAAHFHVYPTVAQISAITVNCSHDFYNTSALPTRVLSYAAADAV